MINQAKEAEPRKLVHVARLAVRWSDMDVNRHVNNVVYLRYFEQARIEWLDHALHDRRTDAHGIVIANAHCEYRRPLSYPATIERCLYACAPGRSSFTFHYEIYPERARSDEYAHGYTRVVWVDRRTGRSTELPEFLRDLVT